MWDKLFAWLRVAWDSGAETQRNSKLIRETMEQNEQFARMIQLLFVQQAHERELRDKDVARLSGELENLKQSVENRIQEAERRALIEAENCELRLRLEMAQQMKQLPPLERMDK